MKSETHKIEKATSQAANGYRISALEAEIKELKKQLKVSESLRIDYKTEIQRLKQELRSVTSWRKGDDKEDED